MLGGPNSYFGHAPPSALSVGGGGEGWRGLQGGLARISRLAVSEEKKNADLRKPNPQIYRRESDCQAPLADAYASPCMYVENPTLT